MLFNDSKLNTHPSPNLNPAMTTLLRFHGKTYTLEFAKNSFSSLGDLHSKRRKNSAEILKKEIEFEREEERSHEQELAQRKLKLRTRLHSHIFFETLLKELRQK